MKSPAITTYSFKKEEYVHYSYSDDSKLVSSGNFFHTQYKSWSCSEERFDNISQWAIEAVHDCDYVWLEGYSYGSKGLVFHIAENTAHLKRKLWLHKIPFDTPTPGTIKKFATGNGHATKPLMEEQWMKEVGIDIREKLGQKWRKNCKPPESPTADIIDSYFLCKFGIATVTKS